MNKIKTFYDGNYWGYYSLREVINLEKDAKTKAHNAQKKNPADHMVYSTKEYNEDGNLCTVHLYSGYPMDEKTFYERTTPMKNYRIGAYHKMDADKPTVVYFIKKTYVATETNTNFKGETKVYIHGKNGNFEIEEVFLKFLKSNLGYDGNGFSTKAAVAKALKSSNDLAECEMKHGFWTIKNEIVEFTR